MDVTGTTAIVTGAGAGIGEAIALRLAREGAQVIVADDDEPAGRDTVSAIEDAGGRAEFVSVDVTQEPAVRRMVEYAEEAFGALAILVNNVGGYDEPVFPEAEVAHWTANLDRNLRATMLGIHFGVRAMKRRGGAIVNIASTAGLGLGQHPSPEYAAGKAAVMRLTACLAYLADSHIRVNCVCPYTVGTRAVHARKAELEAAGAELPPPLQAVFLDPAEVADAVLALIQDESLAGRTIVLAGGEPPELLPAE
jgi:NAD(P)-dependent dehydrogenase (short-subunit alcohol dehydrogenase family)